MSVSYRYLVLKCTTGNNTIAKFEVLKSYEMTIIIIAISYVAITSMILGIFRAMRDRNMPETEFSVTDTAKEKELPVVPHYSESPSNKMLENVRYA